MTKIFSDIPYILSHGKESCLVYNGYEYCKSDKAEDGKEFWSCSETSSEDRCPAKLQLEGGVVASLITYHDHPPNAQKFV